MTKEYTEEDTFKRLARPTFEEMMALYQAQCNIWDSNGNQDTSKRIPFMKSHGWTWFEFVMENKRRRDAKDPLAIY